MMQLISYRIALLVTTVALLFSAQVSGEFIPSWSAQAFGVDGFFFGYSVRVSVVTDSDGAVYMTSSTLRVQKTDILTVKYASDGTVVWSVTYDGPSENVDHSSDITIDSAGNILVLGRSEGAFLVLRYNAADGLLLDTIQHDPGGIDGPVAFTTDASGNIYITGSSWPSGTANQHDFYTVKLNAIGNTLWTARYNGPGPFLFAYDIPADIALDSNGDVIVTGPSNASDAQPNFVTIKYSGTTGEQIWFQRLSNLNLESVALLVSPEDDVYVTGSAGNDRTPFVTVKYDGLTGAQMWISNNPMGAFGHAFDMAFDSQGDVYVTGRLDPDFDRSTFNENIMTMKIRASDGVREWLSLYGNSAIGFYDECRAIIVDSHDNVFATGSTSSFGEGGLILIQYDAANGQIVDHGTVPSPTFWLKGQEIILDSSENIIVAGMTRSDPGNYMDPFTLKFPTAILNVVGDLDGNGIVNTADLLMLVADWGPCNPKGVCASDINGDGNVNISDLLALIDNWG